MNKERLLKMAVFLEDLPEEKFYFGSYVEEKDENGCGTICCAVGWMPEIFGEDSPVKYHPIYHLVGENDSNPAYPVQQFLDISWEHYNYLFVPGTQNNTLPYHAKPKDVAARIREFCS